jgi:hypothetical protein
MVRALILLVVAGMAFGGAAGGAMWWQQHAAAASADGEHAEEAGHEADAHAAPVTMDAHADSHASDAGHEPLPVPPDAGLPVSVRPQPMSVEELLRYGLSLNAREAALHVREDEARNQEIQIQLAIADIQSEQQSIEGLRGQVQKQLETADTLLVRIEDGRKALADEQAKRDQELKKFQTERIEMDDQEQQNIKRRAAWLSAMEPSKAGELLKGMVDEGDLSSAVKLLSQLDETKGAQILAAIEDGALVNSLMAEYTKLKMAPSKKPSKR